MKKLLIFILTLFLFSGCSQKKEIQQKEELNIYSLSGPTSMGLAKLLDDNANGTTANSYVSTIVTDASEVSAALANQSADIALLPANLAANLYNKSADFKVVTINTLGVLYIVENGDTIQSLDDLKGKTICLTGQGTTPEYALRYLLSYYGIEEEVTLEFKSSAAEVATYLASDMESIGLLPQPFVTSALMQNSSLRIALSLSDLWTQTGTDSTLVTGVTVIRNEILENYPQQVEAFLQEYQQSIDWVNENPKDASVFIENLGIVGKAAIAEKALPQCNLVFITGSEMKTQLSGYLTTLYNANPATIGGQLPDDDFYYEN